MFGFSVVLMASWETILATAPLGLLNGGTAGLLYTNLATWIGFIAVYAFVDTNIHGVLLKL
ncbi:hypothetical protein LTR37_001173 [Vermiconidia calcicola]|uniref:Uncharacterized protein n=1 Tax=Vermiconidia calcicola TaxID=1690605 RepID=A0ACC3NW53_9PEZI|nr:hypothetical protein LTR37_001173 [Vermiconidia calcicola]